MWKELGFSRPYREMCQGERSEYMLKLKEVPDEIKAEHKRKKLAEKYAANREEKIAYARRRRVTHADAVRRSQRASYLKNAEAVKERSRDYSRKNRSRRLRVQAEYRERHSFAVKMYDCLRRYEGKDKVRARNRERYRTDPAFRIKSLLRTRLWELTNRAGRASSTLEMSSESLRAHLESLWTEGMSWENYGLSGWHVDHKLPCSYFDFSDPEQARKCFALSNLQPMWAADNIRKSNKILEEYANAAA